MNTQNPEIIKNTILHIFTTEGRLLSKKEVVKITKLSNRAVKGELDNLEKEGYLKKTGGQYHLIKTTEPAKIIKRSTREIQKDMIKTRLRNSILNIFMTFRDTDSILTQATICTLVEGNYTKNQIRNTLKELVNDKKLTALGLGNYSLINVEPKKVEATEKKRVRGTTDKIREIILNLPPKFDYTDVQQEIGQDLAKDRIEGSLYYLVKQKELFKVSPGKFSPVNTKSIVKPKQISATQAREVKKDIKRKETQISATQAREIAEKRKLFVRLQLGYKSLGSDYALVIKLGPGLIKELNWEKGNLYEMFWSYEERCITLSPDATGSKLFCNDCDTYELVIPLPEGVGAQFPKPNLKQSGGKHAEIDIPMEQVKRTYKHDVHIYLHNVQHIEYV